MLGDICSVIFRTGFPFRYYCQSDKQSNAQRSFTPIFEYFSLFVAAVLAILVFIVIRQYALAFFILTPFLFHCLLPPKMLLGYCKATHEFES